MMRLEGICKAFGSVQALVDVDLAIVPGTLTVLLGPSGSGKSTCLRSMNLLELPDRGRLVIGDELLEFRPHHRPKYERIVALRRRTGMIFQNFQLFPHLNARANVSLGLRTVRRFSAERADVLAADALYRVGLSDKLTAFPAQLSGGQQQRVAIARALAMEPDLLLCDEPTSALDPELAGEVVDVLARLAREGMTMVMATHDLRLARDVAQQVVFMEAGRVVESGTAASLFQSPRQARTAEFLAKL